MIGSTDGDVWCVRTNDAPRVLLYIYHIWRNNCGLSVVLLKKYFIWFDCRRMAQTIRLCLIVVSFSLMSYPPPLCITFVSMRRTTTLNSTRPAQLLMVQRRPLNFCAVSTTSTGKCAPTGWNLTPTRRSSSGSEHVDSCSKSAVSSRSSTAFQCPLRTPSETSASLSTLSCRSSSTSTPSYAAVSTNSLIVPTRNRRLLELWLRGAL